MCVNTFSSVFRARSTKKADVSTSTSKAGSSKHPLPLSTIPPAHGLQHRPGRWSAFWCTCCPTSPTKALVELAVFSTTIWSQVDWRQGKGHIQNPSTSPNTRSQKPSLASSPWHPPIPLFKTTPSWSPTSALPVAPSVPAWLRLWPHPGAQMPSPNVLYPQRWFPDAPLVSSSAATT